MFTNKHLVVALLVTPVLAILAWFAVGAFVGEKPQPAIAGQSYPLVERSNCRYDSGQCDLRNEDMRLSITLEEGTTLVVTANQALERVLVAEAPGPDATTTPFPLTGSEDGRRWSITLQGLPEAGARLQFAVQAGGSSWYAETSTAFLDRYRAGASDG